MPSLVTAQDLDKLRPIDPVAIAAQLPTLRAEEYQAMLGPVVARQKALSEGFGKGFDQEQKLRKEYDKMSQGYRESLEGYGKVRAAALTAAPTGADDIALVFGFMKTIDPTSVVREGEFATAEQTAGVPARIRTTYNKLVNGQRLSPQQRKYFLDAATRQFSSLRPQQVALESRYGGLANAYRLPSANIVEKYSDKFSDVFKDLGGKQKVQEPDSLRNALQNIGGKENPVPLFDVGDIDNYPIGTFGLVKIDGKMKVIERTD